jgi:cytochrome c oxidase subunit II
MRRSTATGLLVVAIGLGGTTFGGVFLAHAQTNNANQEQVIKIVARRFAYTPNEIVLKKGQPVILEFTAIDFVHGFKIPDLNIRADLPPGKVTRIPITPEKAGVYDFLCDNFCGTDHEDMNGRILVKD